MRKLIITVIAIVLIIWLSNKGAFAQSKPVAWKGYKFQRGDTVMVKSLFKTRYFIIADTMTHRRGGYWYQAWYLRTGAHVECLAQKGLKHI